MPGMSDRTGGAAGAPVLTRRRVAGGSLLLAAATAAAARPFPAAAQGGGGGGGGAAAGYPQRPIQVIVPAAPGGSTDLATRLISAHAMRELGQPLVVDNRGGGGGVIGLRAAARAAPDGYTLVMGNPGPVAVAPHTVPDIGYDVLADFAPVSLIMRVPLVLVVRADLPVRSVAELVAYIRARPGAVAFGTAGPGQTPHLAAELFARAAGLDLIVSPFRGSAPALNAMLAGDMQGGFDSGGALAHVRAGTLRALAVSGRTRSALLPDLPTMEEAGFPDFTITSWFVLLAPARTPPAILQRLNGVVAGALADPEVRQRLASANAEAAPTTPEEARAFLRQELDNWGAVVRRIAAAGN